MTEPSLKLGRLPDRKPIKLTLALAPDLQADLQDYATLYARAYGDTLPIAALIPSMLAAFLASDAGFRKARKTL
ncbi:MAG TPA: DUF2274 domain-containing protein [Hyphomonas sp.]|jgi:hypothetical protein|uniref:DUF2274 domain-containing protein n=1 Tax=uncultured Hyphomonas sp. TaxID=225298 RepID=UPI000C509CD6|nr:transposase [Hyphomonas sp.]MAN91723.1 transposase [Hyphomonadaceae bacterium]HBL93058.1 DUF2274 domain-containing protein [Hyphomonas sp.]HCJ18889.1 DUF2274 domain-containing protein [Hyphomonas sp.]|tara:strand:- start:7302 stop:7523 length:222 start_codon:yes stop_codon:yes gene_type:complete